MSSELIKQGVDNYVSKYSIVRIHNIRISRTPKNY